MTTADAKITNQTASDVLTNGIHALQLSRRAVLALYNDVPDDKLVAQPFDGANHLLWQLGHITVTDDQVFQTLCDAKPLCPDGWNERFGMGSTPVSDASAYPSLDEIKTKAEHVRQTLIEWFQAQSEDTLGQSAPEPLRSMTPTIGSIMSFLAFHEGMHVGQISSLRKAMGLPRVFG